MHPAYLDLQGYIEAADDRDLRAAEMAERVRELMDDVLAELSTVLPHPVQVLRSGSAGCWQLPVLVADLDIDGTEVKARCDGNRLQLWLAGAELSLAELSARLPRAPRRLFHRRHPRSPRPTARTATRLDPTATG